MSDDRVCSCFFVFLAEPSMLLLCSCIFLLLFSELEVEVNNFENFSFTAMLIFVQFQMRTGLTSVLV